MNRGASTVEPNRMRKRGVLVALLVTVVGGLLVAWLAYPSVGALLVRRELEKHGIQVVEVAPITLSGRSITLPRLVLRHPSVASTPIRLEDVAIVLQRPTISDPLRAEVEEVTVAHTFIDEQPVRVVVNAAERRATITLPPTKLSEPALATLLRRFAPQLSPLALAGEIEVVLTHSPVQTSLRAQFRDGQAEVSGTPALGIRGSLNLQLLPHLSTIDPAILQIAEIQALTPISELRVQVTGHAVSEAGRYDIEIQSARAALLGGVVSVVPGRLVSGSQHHLTVKFRGIDLTQLLSLYPQSAVRATGKLRGTVPLTFAAPGVSVRNGLVLADPPTGTLQATLPDGALPDDHGGQMRLVREALRNFHYTKLEADLTAEPSGAIHLATRLTGGNPELNNGRLMNVNIGIDENIVDLLGSIRAAANVGEGL